ncbi:MAG: hypothetical protein FGM46_07475 [Ferruginibacter sp.]|nr:hypothetical protein [Ferruginibacter sp.]
MTGPLLYFKKEKIIFIKKFNTHKYTQMKKIILLYGYFVMISISSYAQQTAIALSADKMNVLYLGIDNPITIGNSEQTFENTVVTATNATISGVGSKRFVKPTSLDEVVISVSSKGSQPSAFTFRVKKIPDPKLKLGTSKHAMDFKKFYKLDSVSLDMEDFAFDFDMKIIDATVYFSGEGFPVPVQARISGGSLANIKGYMQKCMPGSAVTFDNVRIQTPEGPRTIEGVSIRLF